MQNIVDNLIKMEEDDINNIDLLHPELLSSNTLRFIISTKYAKVNYLPDLSKEMLLEMYYKIVMPLPQRIYQRNRRGACLSSNRGSNNQEKMDSLPPQIKKMDSLPPQIKKMDSLPPQFANVISENSTKISHSADSYSRLKPPPTDIGFNKKIIRLKKSNDVGISSLNRATSSVSDSGKKIIRLNNNSLKSMLKVESHKKLIEESGNLSQEIIPPKKKHKPITWP